MVYKTLVYFPFGHLTGLLARESLVEDKVNYCHSPLYQPTVVHSTVYTTVWFSIHGIVHMWGRDSSVGIATDYGLDDPGIESRRERNFSHTSRPALGSTQPPAQWIPGSFPGVKRPGRGADHPPPSSAEVKKSRVILLPHSWPSGLLRGTFTFTFFFQCCVQQLAVEVLLRNMMHGTYDVKMLSCSLECFAFLSCVLIYRN
jgi:hypothetical protein